MSRVGQNPILFSENIDVSKEGNLFKAKGPLGELKLEVIDSINIEIDNKFIKVTNSDNSQKGQAIWGTTRALINNMIKGVSEGFTKMMELNGVGYRAQVQGNKVVLNLGYSHPVEMIIPEGIKVTSEKPTELKLFGYNKQDLGQFAANLRSKRPPEPFKGKGIKYSDEFIFRKEGKKK